MIRGVWIVGAVLALAPWARAEDSVCRLHKRVPKLDIQRTTRLTRIPSMALEGNSISSGPDPCGSENFIELQNRGNEHAWALTIIVRDASGESLQTLPVGSGGYQLMRDPDRLFVSRSGADSLILDCKGKQIASLPQSAYGGRAGTSTVSANDRFAYVLPQGASSPVRFQPGAGEKIDRVSTFDKDHVVVTTFSASKKESLSPIEQNVYLLDSAGKVTTHFKTDSAVASTFWRDWSVDGITRLPGDSGFVVRTNGATGRPGAAWQLGLAQPGVYLFTPGGQFKKFIPTEGLPDKSRVLPDGKIAVEVHRGFTDRRVDRNYMLIVDPKTGQSKELAEFEYPVDFGISGNGNTVSIDRKKHEILQMSDRGERLPATSIVRAPDAAHTTRSVRIEGMADGPGGATLVLLRETDFLRPPPRNEWERRISGASISGTRSRAVLLPAAGGPVAADSVFDVGREAQLLPVGNDSTVVHGADGLVLLDPKLGVRARFKPDRGKKILSVKSIDDKRLGVTFQYDGSVYLGFFDKDTLALVGRVQAPNSGYGGAPRFTEKRGDGTIHLVSEGAAAIVQTGPDSDSTLKAFVMGPCARVGSAQAKAASTAAPAGERP